MTAEHFDRRYCMNEITITLTGNLDTSYVGELEQTLIQSVEEEGIEFLTLDFASCTMVDSAGIGLLVKAQNTLKPKGGGVVITNLNEKIMRMFEMMHLDKHLEIRK